MFKQPEKVNFKETMLMKLFSDRTLKILFLTNLSLNYSHKIIHLLCQMLHAVIFYYLLPGAPAGDYNLHHVCAWVCASVCHSVFSETTTVTHFW